jgi:hypothetical protein
MMEEFANLLHTRGIDFDGVDRKIMCFAHVINICCQHTIKEFTNIDLSESSSDFIAEELLCLPRLQTIENAVKRDPVALGRNIVRLLRSSGQRRETFDQLIRDGNKSGWFETKVPELQLLRDVKTRWDSVYLMLRRLRELRPVRYCCVQFCSCLTPIGIGHRSLLFITN